MIFPWSVGEIMIYKYSANRADLSRSNGNINIQINRKIYIYPIFKRIVDIGLSVALVPFLVVSIVVAIILNPFFNKGPVIFVQKRMGKSRKPFYILKLRTMTPSTGLARTADGTLEYDRITKFGKFMRKSRMDELPQIINVLRGEMSFIGPRPDMYDHAVEYVRTIPGYADRHRVVPGISGLAQVEVGYAEGIEATRSKVSADLEYIDHAGIRMDLWLLWRTFVTVTSHKGS